jgi:hypothetical protein
VTFHLPRAINCRDDDDDDTSSKLAEINEIKIKKIFPYFTEPDIRYRILAIRNPVTENPELGFERYQYRYRYRMSCSQCHIGCSAIRQAACYTVN